MEIIKYLQSFSDPFINNLFQVITFLGEETLYVLVIVILYWCVNKKTALRLAFIQIFSLVTNGAIKDMVKAPRPIGEEGIFSLRVTTATGYSFPSGHTQGTTTFWSSLMKIYKKTWLYAIGSVSIIAVAISRLYLGVHWPQDVAAGIVFGILSMLVADKIMFLAYKKNNYRYMLLLVVPALVGLLIFPSKDYVKAAATVLGLYIGYVLESTYIFFTVKASLLNHLLKVVVGLVGIGLLKIFVKALLPNNNIEALVDYFLLGLWVTAGAPYIFVKLGISTPTMNIDNELNQSL